MSEYDNAAQIVWLALRNVPDALEVIGIFASEDDALRACEQREDVIGPIPYGRKLNDIDWPGAYYPLAQSGGAV
jgi:hypothetical protein